MRRRKLFVILTCFYVGIFKCCLAHSQEFDIRVAENLQLNYQPFSGLSTSGNIRISVNLSSGLNGELENLEVTRGKRVRLRIRNAKNKPFQAVSDSQNLLPISLTSNARGARLVLSNNEYRQDLSINQLSTEPVLLDYLVSVPETVFATTGIYRLGLEVDLFDLSTNKPIAATDFFEIVVMVEPRLQVNFAGTHSPSSAGMKLSTVNFGKLETGESRKIFIQVRGNAPAKITVSSENNGRLKLQDHEDEFVNYSVLVDGADSNLASPLKLNRAVAQNLIGSSFPVMVKIGDVDGAFAGEYKDVLMVDVRPQ